MHSLFGTDDSEDEQDLYDKFKTLKLETRKLMELEKRQINIVKYYTRTGHTVSKTPVAPGQCAATCMIVEKATKAQVFQKTYTNLILQLFELEAR